MTRVKPYVFEHGLIALTMLVSVLGFWEIYLGADDAPNAYQHLHLAVNFLWLFLLWHQLSLIGQKRHRDHRRIGLAILVMAPVLVATTALLSVHSAHKGMESGEGDALIVQNVMGTLALGLLVVLAFVLRKRRKVHGALLLSTVILFMGIALFFALIGFAPQFQIEGPETFDRFAKAAIAGQAIALAIAILLFVKDFRHGWPFLLAGLFFVPTELIRSSLAGSNLIEPLTEFVGSLHPALTFVVTFVVVLGLLAATGVANARGGGGRDALGA